MRVMSGWILILLAALLAGTAGSAPTAAEQRALAAADRSFQLGFWERAEKQFAAIAEQAPAKSELRAQACLRQAQAQFQQGQFTNAIDRLTTRQREAGRLADEYQFWLGEAQFQNLNFPAAAAAYARLVKDFPGSARFAEASYAEALARSKLAEWSRVIELLRQPGGAFAKAAAQNPTNETVIRGGLLLAEAQFALKDFPGAEQTARALPGQKLSPELDWRRQFLLGRLQLANDQPSEALAGITNLIALAAASGQRDLQTESALLHGSILERLKRFDDAVAAYETNLATDLPLERRRQAVLKIVELLLARNKTAAAAQRLESFLGQYGKDKAVDAGLLTVGELQLREYLAHPTANSNDWAQAATQFDLMITNYPRSPLLGKALLNRAWCWWVVDKIPESATAFQQAATRATLAADLHTFSGHLPATDTELHQVLGRRIGHVRGVEPRTGVHTLVEVDLLGVDVAVEVDDAHLLIAQMAANAANCGESDRVVAAENDWEGATRKYVGYTLRDLIETLLIIGWNRENIAHIAKGDLLPQVDTHLVVIRGVQR